MRRIVFLIVCLSMIMGTIVCAYANDMPRYQYAERVKATISSSGNTVHCISKLTGKNGVTTSVTGTMTLQKRSGGAWSKVKTWSGESNGSNLTISKNKNVTSGTYRVKAVL